MLQTNPESVCRLIELARAVHVRELENISEEHNSPGDDWDQQMLAGAPDNSSALEFQSIVEDLEPDQQQEVVALMWLGRGDYNSTEWREAFAQAKELWSPNTAGYLLRHPMVADHLEEGLEAKGYSCQDIRL